MIILGKTKEYKIINKIKTAEGLAELIELAEKHSFCGNLWHCFMAYLIMTDENPFSVGCERRQVPDNALTQTVKADFDELYTLFNRSMLDEIFDDYTPMKMPDDETVCIGTLASEFAKKLENASDADEFFKVCTDFYEAYGVGELGLYRAFVLGEDGALVPVTHFRRVTLSDLWGYDVQKAQLLDNTRAFVNGKDANNVLLYGDSGTGKSTCIKAILNEFYKDGLRMIQVQKSQFKHLGDIIGKIKHRGYAFVLYMDDLSFEDFEIEYKYLKAIIEGGLEEKPKNLVIYATSNRRHLIRETWKERGDDDVHRNESMQEKISLSDRFGLQIYFMKPMQTQYFDMVEYLAKKAGLDMSREALEAAAKEWGIAHSGLSGRAAEQLIKHLSKEF